MNKPGIPPAVASAAAAALERELSPLQAALYSLTACASTSAADFSVYRADSWLYGIIVGWDCEEGHEHDGICGGTEAMDEVAARHGWDGAQVARLRRYRKAYAAAKAESSSVSAERYSFTRPELIEALTHLEVNVATTGPLAGKILAESMADALIKALEAAA